MNRFLMLLAAIFFALHTLSSAQILVAEEKIITFDKLTKTIIPFTASAQPAVKIEPSGLEGRYALALSNGKGTLTFTSPVPAGTYTITFSLAGQTAKTTWSVIPAGLDSKSMKTLSVQKVYYGIPFTISARLPQAAALPLQQFNIEYQYGNQLAVRNVPFSELWMGPHIPASTKKVQFGVVWIYPPTGESVPMFRQEFSAEQTPLKVKYSGSTTQNEFDPKTNSYTLTNDNIGLDYNVPIDADNSNPLESKAISATLGEVEAENASIDYTSTELNVYYNNDLDPMSSWVANPTTFKLTDGSFDPAKERYSIKIQMSGLPMSGTRVRGKVAIKMNAKIVNRKAGVAATSSELTFLEIDIPINTTIPASNREITMVSLPSNVVLKQQTWMPEQLKASGFEVFFADSLTTEELRNAIMPQPKKTPAVESAEKECINTDDIILRIRKKQPVPQSLINEGASPADCETVKNFYISLATYRQSLSHVAILVGKGKTGNSPELLGAVALRSDSFSNKQYPVVKNPVKFYSVENMKTLMLGSTTLYDVLTKQVSTIQQSGTTQKATLETFELAKKSATQKGTKAK
ncbi:MAG: hypothetical protein EAZ92_14850 [Candidatus Kapaibacterium sp.]|nr:MAG: hypothetical protein EAZ92_14850 [Candidatus Kapabacteria bacterium]